MIISEAMRQKLCEQVTNELSAAHKYLAMACHLRDRGLTIFAERFTQQSDEERGHAMRIIKYVQDTGGLVSLGSIPQPEQAFANVKAVVEAALDSEMTVTRQINNLMALAEKESDYATRSFLQWFVTEQVEEVATITELLQWVSLAGENLFLIEHRLAQKMKEDGGEADE